MFLCAVKCVFFIIKPIFLHKKSRRFKTSALLKKCCSVFLYQLPHARGFIFYTKPDNEFLFWDILTTGFLIYPAHRCNFHPDCDNDMDTHSAV